MRTTLNLDQDVLDRAHKAAGELRQPFRQVVNEALRRGIEEIGKAALRRPYQTQARDLGLREGFCLDNIQEVLSQAEGEDRR